MKANEFRIGNWVNQPTADNSDSFHQITKGDFASDYNSSIDIECQLPIPLTEEWLLKFGFKKDADGNFCIEFNDTNYKAYIIDASNGIHAFGVSYQDDTFYFAWNIEYVHQLQNLYFALTGEELTA